MDILRPMSVYDDYFVWYGDDTIEPYDSGKWMLFYPKEELDERWFEIIDLYEAKMLGDVHQMKCSTALENSRATDVKYGVIILYCLYSKNKEYIMRTGREIVKNVRHLPNSPNFYYKTDEQTYLGTRATGQKRNHIYSIKNPRFQAKK